MNKKFLTLSLLMLGVASLGVGSVYAYQGDPNVKGPDYSLERHEAMTKAFANKDYNVWKEIRGDKGNGRMMEVINNKEKFAKFVEIRELRLAGKTEEANALRAELGLGLGQGKDGNMKRGGQENYDGQRRGMGRNAERG
ncbi:hypothetical protein GQ568_01645 [Patescibacteria group bacterium]|nr:hypothetical protein [Patescibacteria group bacterium]